MERLSCLPITMQYACERIGAKYLDYATDYRTLAEGQIHIAEEFGFDYVNTMSDPACEASDCGAAVKYYADQPPALDESNALLAEKSALLKLRMPSAADPGRMNNRLKALALLRERVGGQLLVEGWIEGPCAEAADLRGINTLMTDFFDDPAFVTDLFEFVLAMELDFAKQQVAAGAEQIGIGDAACSLIGPRFYRDYVLPYEKRMVAGVQALGVPARLHICGDTRSILEGMAELRCDIVDLDYLSPVAMGRERMGPEQVILGNLDPVRLMRDGTPEQIHAAFAECHAAAGPRYIVGPGCEIPRGTPPENIRAMVEYARHHAPNDLPAAH